MKLAIAAATALFVTALWACGSRTEESTGAEQVAGQPSQVAGVLGSYENIRAKLASDETVSAADFERLAEAARAVSEESSGDVRTHLEELADTAGSVAKKVNEGLPQASEAFGEVSRRLVSLLGASPDLAKGQFVFECTMAKSYPKWVKQSQTVSNPYMGSEMATCGVVSSFER